jgi:hypothetical protein
MQQKGVWGKWLVGLLPSTQNKIDKGGHTHNTRPEPLWGVNFGVLKFSTLKLTCTCTILQTSTIGISTLVDTIVSQAFRTAYVLGQCLDNGACGSWCIISEALHSLTGTKMQVMLVMGRMNVASGRR